MLHCKFSGDYNSERIFKIGQYLTKLCVQHLWFTFLAHPVSFLSPPTTRQSRVFRPRYRENTVKLSTVDTAVIRPIPLPCDSLRGRLLSLSCPCSRSRHSKLASLLLDRVGRPFLEARPCQPRYNNRRTLIFFLQNGTGWGIVFLTFFSQRKSRYC